jgi:sugar phosphate permease
MFKNYYRWEMLFWVFFIVLVSYFDRVNFSISAPLIMKEFGIGAALMGIIMSGFNIGYTLMNFYGGFLAEKYSARKLMTFIILLWSLMTVFTGLGWSFTSLLVIRIVFGICEGPLVLINTKLVNRWMLPKERATASGLWLAAMPIGVMIGGILSGVIVAGYGWRSVFYIFGIVGIIAAVLNWIIMRDQPEDHPSISKTELDLIKSSIVQHDGLAALNAPGSTLMGLLKNPLVWAISAVYFAILMFMWGNLNWLPTYFMKARGSSLLKSGIFSSIPWIGAAVGPLILGWLSDRSFFIKTRAGWVALSLFVIVPTVVYAVITPDLYVSLACFTIASFFAMAAMGQMFALAMEIFERANIAKVSGIMLASGSLAGIIAPSLIGFVLEATNSFNNAYYFFGATAFVGGCLSFILIRKEKVVRRDKSAAARETAAVKA